MYQIRLHVSPEPDVFTVGFIQEERIVIVYPCLPVSKVISFQIIHIVFYDLVGSRHSLLPPPVCLVLRHSHEMSLVEGPVFGDGRCIDARP